MHATERIGAGRVKGWASWEWVRLWLERVAWRRSARRAKHPRGERKARVFFEMP